MAAARYEPFAVLIALVFPTLVTLAYFVLAADAPAAVQQATYSVGKTLQFALPLFWLLAIERRRPRWQWPRRGDLIAGLALGLVVGGAALALYYAWIKPASILLPATAAIEAKVTGIGIDSAAKFAVLAVFYSLVHSLLEEYYWRWFVFGSLRNFVSPRTAILVSSIGFTAHHALVLAWYFGWMSPLTVLFSLAVAIGGAAWAWLYERSGALWGVWLSHLLVDAAIFAVGYDLVRG